MYKSQHYLSCILLILLLLTTGNTYAQRSGLIFQAAGSGSSVLDPNGDGYVSATSAGFSTSDYAESEIPYVRVPQMINEPNSDLATGPDCGFTDFVDDGTEFAAGTYFDGTNMLFRFRLANTANNSKGYSILIDTDQKMGANGEHKDPNYVKGNPGFEIEIVLQTNFGVYLYDVDGTASPVQEGSTYPYADHCQKAIAENLDASITCSNKYFYDFFIPFSAITTHFTNITSSTPLRFVANTVISPNSVLEGPISDIQGVEDAGYGSSDLAWTAAISNIYPTSVSAVNTGFGNDRTTTIPTLNGPILPAATSVSVTVAAAGEIKMYVEGNSTPVCSTTVGSSGTHNVTGCASFTAGQVVYATLTESGYSESARSNMVTVFSCNSTVTAAPTGLATAQNEKKLTGSCVSGATVRVYRNGVYYGTATTTTTTWEFDACVAGGNVYPQNCLECGTWQATAENVSLGHCESALSEAVCISGSARACTLTYTVSTTPIITTPLYNTDKQISGTTTSGATVYVYINNILNKTVTANGTSWTATGLTLNTSDAISVRALSTGGNYCRSAAVTATVQQGVSLSPVVEGPILAGATTILGSSVEPAGTTITVYVNGGSIGTTAVQSDGSWSISTTALVAGNTVHATATASGKTVSANSSTVTVAAAALTFAPTITTTPAEGATSVTVEMPSSLATGTYFVALYLDGYQVALSSSVSHSNGVNETTNITGLSGTPSDDDYLYAGNKLTATIYASGQTVASQGPYSNEVIVTCTNPSDRSWSVNTNFLDDPGAVLITVISSEAGVVYTITNSDGSIFLGNSKVGTGSDVVLTSDSLSTTTTLYVKADKIGQGCTAMMTGSEEIVVDVEAVYTNNTTGKGINDHYEDNEVLATVTDADAAVTSASVTSGSLPAGTSLATDGTITVSDKSLLPSGTHNFTVSTSSTLNGNIGTTASALEMTFQPGQLPVDLISFTATSNGPVVDIDWVTAMEENNAYFTVERSADGIVFTPLLRREGAGTSYEVNIYREVDEKPLSGISYYRLKQTDFNGSFTFSPIVGVKRIEDMERAVRMELYPNPSSASDLNVSLYGIAMATATMQITDDAGRVYGKCQLNANTPMRNIKLHECLNVDLTPGAYTLTVSDGTSMITKRFIINR